MPFEFSLNSNSNFRSVEHCGGGVGWHAALTAAAVPHAALQLSTGNRSYIRGQADNIYIYKNIYM